MRPLHLWNVSLILGQDVALDLFLYGGLLNYTLNGGVHKVGALLPRIGIGRVGLFIQRLRFNGGETLDVISVVGGIGLQCLVVNLNVFVEFVVLFQPLQRPQDLVCVGFQWNPLVRSYENDYGQVCGQQRKACGKFCNVLVHSETVALEKSGTSGQPVDLHDNKHFLNGTLLNRRQILQCVRHFVVRMHVIGSRPLADFFWGTPFVVIMTLLTHLVLVQLLTEQHLFAVMTLNSCKLVQLSLVGEDVLEERIGWQVMPGEVIALQISMPCLKVYPTCLCILPDLGLHFFGGEKIVRQMLHPSPLPFTCRFLACIRHTLVVSCSAAVH